MGDRCWRKRCGAERPRGSRSGQWQGFLRIALHPYGGGRAVIQRAAGRPVE